MTELIPKEVFEKAESGSHFIPDSVLFVSEEFETKEFEELFRKFSLQHPHFSFGAVYDPYKRGATIYWRPNVLNN